MRVCIRPDVVWTQNWHNQMVAFRASQDRLAAVPALSDKQWLLLARGEHHRNGSDKHSTSARSVSVRRGINARQRKPTPLPHRGGNASRSTYRPQSSVATPECSAVQACTAMRPMCNAYTKRHTRCVSGRTPRCQPTTQQAESRRQGRARQVRVIPAPPLSFPRSGPRSGQAPTGCPASAPLGAWVHAPAAL